MEGTWSALDFPIMFLMGSPIHFYFWPYAGYAGKIRYRNGNLKNSTAYGGGDIGWCGLNIAQVTIKTG